MTPQERKTEFNRLFESIPGKNIDRVKAVAEVLFCRPNTVRIWRIKSPTRIIPEAKLLMLKRHFAAATE
jgi:hypothetical protein